MSKTFAGLALCLVAVGCGGVVDSDPTERLAAAELIYHTGCDQMAVCAAPRRVCAMATSEASNALTGGTSVVIEWEAPDTVVGIRTYYWFIEPDGSGDFYHELRSDTAGSDTGWRVESYGNGELFDGATLQLAPGAPSNVTEIVDLSLCGWP